MLRQEIFERLDMGAALRLKSLAEDERVQNFCKQRVNPAAFFSKTFQYPVTLLSAMFDSGSCLVGGRAVEFFTPVWAVSGSTWDFFVPCYKESVADMITALRLSGVEWELAADAIAKALAAGESIDVDVHTLQILSSWMTSVPAGSAKELMGSKTCEALAAFHHQQAVSGKVTIGPGPQGAVIISPKDATLDEGSLSAAAIPVPKMVQGTISTPTGTQMVRLVIGGLSSPSCVDFIKSFYTRPMQCFVGGWCAVHLNYDIVSFQRHDDRPTVRPFRAIDDSKAMFLDYGTMYKDYVRSHNYPLLESWLAERRKNAHSIRWIEENGDQSVHADRAVAREMNWPISLVRYSLPLSRLRRLADIISLGTCKPDEWRTDLFRSSVRKTLTGAQWTVREVARSGSVPPYLVDAPPCSWVM